MKKSQKEYLRNCRSDDELARDEIHRTNARLRHFRGIAAGVLSAARGILQEVWDACQDPRSWQEILDGVPEPVARAPMGGWAQFYERLHILEIHLDYAQRLCEGSIDQEIQQEREGKPCSENSTSSQTTTSPISPKFCLPKKI